MRRGFVTETRTTPSHLTVQPKTKAIRRTELIRRNATSDGKPNAFMNWCSTTIGVVASSLLFIAPPAVADIERFPASANPEVYAVQKTLVEAWHLVEHTYVDKTGDFWRQDLRSHMLQVYKAEDSDTAYESLKTMLEDLGDPYTRLVMPEEYDSFRTDSNGEIQGVGLLIGSDPSNGKIVVLAPLRGSPAEKAGILPGDELLSINGRSTEGLDGKEAAKSLRGKNGTTVTVKLVRRTEGIPGVPSRIEEKPHVKYKSVQMKREIVELNPVVYQNIEEEGRNLGYIKLASFSDKASNGVHQAIASLESNGADAFVLDLRRNPGGLVNAGMDIARLWLDGPAPIFHVSGRNVNENTDITLPDGEAMTQKPLIVLVDEGSASASEILAGALHDNHRAKIIGSRTYGKGKIQNIFELQDGSALFVTVARYQTPNYGEIDGKGIVPDAACFPNKPTPISNNQSITVEEKTFLEAKLELDDCFQTAQRFLNKQIPPHT